MFTHISTEEAFYKVMPVLNECGDLTWSFHSRTAACILNGDIVSISHSSLEPHTTPGDKSRELGPITYQCDVIEVRKGDEMLGSFYGTKYKGESHRRGSEFLSVESFLWQITQRKIYGANGYPPPKLAIPGR